MNKPVYVTQPFLPPLEKFQKYLEEIWQSKSLTNNGPFHQQLEKEMAQFLGVKFISLFANGTLALLTALQALKVTGEVITTPYSFVATTHALWWNNLTPVFVDIEPNYCTLDPDKIEAAITPKTTAILPVHVYGNPCKVDRIQEIADIYGLKLIYDAAHAFGVKRNNSSILNFGDLSIMSFHATKVFNTFEGGAIVCHDEKTKKRIDDLKNFGFHDELTVVAPGINAKMNEFQAALGLLQLNYFEKVRNKRRKIVDIYKRSIAANRNITFIQNASDTLYNYAYFPIIFKQGFEKREEIYYRLKKNNIFSRRYFYPLISNLPTYRRLSTSEISNLPVANQLSNTVLCLPVYPDLDTKTIESIVDLLND